MKHEITTRNTKRIIADSLKRIMERKSFSKITVREIVDGCGINRNTFYYHFEDIYDLLKWMLEQETIEIVKSFDLITDSEEAILFVLNYVEENKHILNCAYDSIGKDELRRFFKCDFNDIILKLINTIEKKLGAHNNEDYKSFLCDFYSGAIAGKLIDIFRSRGPYDKNEFVKFATATIKRGLMAALDDRYEDKLKIE